MKAKENPVTITIDGIFDLHQSWQSLVV